MTDIEKYIIEHRSDLDLEEPSSGHMRRFNRMLPGESRVVAFRNILQIAALFTVILASGIVIVKSSNGTKKVAVVERQEVAEVQDYYAHQVNVKYEELAGFQFTSQSEKEFLLEELTELDEHYKGLLEELDANPGDERVIHALIQHYQVKMRVMDQIIEQLLELQNIKKEENEEAIS